MYCDDEDDGLISYLGLYYCSFQHAKWAAWFILLPWLAFLFTTIGVCAGDFFSVNLSSLSSILSMSDTLAGVTLLALGNGSPDIFSTFAAMSSGSPSLAIGELVGAAGFITTVVAGSMAAVKPFKIKKASFIRDAGFLFVTAACLLLVLLTKELHLWQSVAMLVFYAFYVATVMVYHWWLIRKQQPISDRPIAGHSDAENGHVVEFVETQPLLPPTSGRLASTSHAASDSVGPEQSVPGQHIQQI